MAWRRPGDKPLSEPMMVSLLTHLCVTRPQWVKWTPQCSIFQQQAGKLVLARSPSGKQAWASGILYRLNKRLTSSGDQKILVSQPEQSSKYGFNFAGHSVQQVFNFWWTYAKLAGPHYVLHWELLEILLDMTKFGGQGISIPVVPFLAVTKHLLEHFFRLFVHPSHPFDNVPVIVSTWNFQLSPLRDVMSMQKVKVKGQGHRGHDPHMAMKWCTKLDVA